MKNRRMDLMGQKIWLTVGFLAHNPVFYIFLRLPLRPECFRVDFQLSESV